MRWPWVSRRTADWLEEGWRRTCAILDDERGKYADLLEKYHALAQPSVPIDAPARAIPIASAPPSIISDVIREQAHGDHRLAAHLRDHAATLRRQGMSEGDIAISLTQWSTTEPVALS